MKNIADTSIESFERLQPTMANRMEYTLHAVERFTNVFGYAPTSGELTDWLYRAKNAFDVNSVRPQLTWLKDAGRIQSINKRPCRITGRTCYTWVIPSPALETAA